MKFQKGQVAWNKGKPRTWESGRKFENGQIPWNKGKKHSPEAIKKMSESHKKNPSRYWLGKKRLSPSEETLSKMSETQIRIGNKPPVQYGEKNNRWRGGITPINNKIRGSIEYTLWENGVFARDGYTCQKCHQTLKPYKLVGHHILNFSSHPELRFAIDNGITFCKKDHKKFHLKYGFKNNTKEQAEEFIN